MVSFFYPMDESPVCLGETEAFKDAFQDFKALNAELVGVSSQSVDSHKSFASKHGLSFLLLSDKDGYVRKLYGVSSKLGVLGRVTFVIDKAGIVVLEHSSQLHPARHAQEALNSLKMEKMSRGQMSKITDSKRSLDAQQSHWKEAYSEESDFFGEEPSYPQREQLNYSEEQA